MSKASCETIEYAGWPKCIRLSDGRTEAIITTDVGPRIIRYGKVGGPNVFYEFPEQRGARGGRKWRIYGGHRLWIAPESKTLSYAPDNSPIEWTWDGKILSLVQPPDQPSGLRKSMAIRFEKGGLRIEHTLSNRSKRVWSIAPWALTVMAPGGVAIVPQEPYGSHEKNLLPARPLVLWKYTKMNDPRFTWGERYILLRQDPNATGPQKFGVRSTLGWMVYALPFATFVKRHPFDPAATYPDMGCNAELFTNNVMLETESLGPLVALKPGARVTHVETWGLSDALIADFTETALDATLPTILRTAPKV